jgi:hypothetical protein
VLLSVSARTSVSSICPPKQRHTEEESQCGEVRPGPGNAQANNEASTPHLGLVEEGVVEREYELAHFVELLDGVGGHCLLRAVLCALYVVRCVWFASFGPDSAQWSRNGSGLCFAPTALL